jgi:hypothetical protein
MNRVHVYIQGGIGAGKSMAMAKTMILYCAKYNGIINNPHLGCTRSSGECSHCKYIIYREMDFEDNPRSFMQDQHDKHIPRTEYQIVQDEIKERQRFLSENPEFLEID